MKFYEYSVWNNGFSQPTKAPSSNWDEENRMKQCLCHREYNHCIAQNENGEIPEIVPDVDLDKLNFTAHFLVDSDRKTAELMSQKGGATTTTPSPEVIHAMGFEVYMEILNRENTQKQK
jgi:hypothetical protein